MKRADQMRRLSIPVIILLDVLTMLLAIAASTAILPHAKGACIAIILSVYGALYAITLADMHLGLNLRSRLLRRNF